VMLVLASALGAYVIGYFVLQILPDAALGRLGLGAADTNVRAALADQKSLGELLTRLATGDLGDTLDGTRVAAELLAGLQSSLPRVAAAGLVVVATIIAVGHAPRPALPGLARLAGILVFLPPFLFPFAGLVLLLAVDGFDSGLQPVVVLLSLALPPSAMVAAQTAAIMTRHLNSAFAINLRARGASRRRQRWLLLPAVGLELLGTLEKLIVGLFTALLFVEPLLGETGFGALMLRAIRRSDLELTLALVLFLAMLVNVARIVAGRSRSRLGGAA